MGRIEPDFIVCAQSSVNVSIGNAREYRPANWRHFARLDAWSNPRHFFRAGKPEVSEGGDPLFQHGCKRLRIEPVEAGQNNDCVGSCSIFYVQFNK
jgi:hypothetical protein